MSYLTFDLSFKANRLSKDQSDNDAMKSYFKLFLTAILCIISIHGMIYVDSKYDNIST